MARLFSASIAAWTVLLARKWWGMRQKRGRLRSMQFVERIGYLVLWLLTSPVRYLARRFRVVVS